MFLRTAGLPTLIPIPSVVGQLVTQGALVVAFFLALLANPRVIIRPNLFLVLLSLLAVVALMVSIHNQFMFGSTFRAFRLIGFISVLWLLTPWWGRSDFVLLRSHIWVLRVVLGTVLVGAVLAPARRSPTIAASPARCGRYLPRRWPTTQPFYSDALWCSGLAPLRGRTALWTLRLRVWRWSAHTLGRHSLVRPLAWSWPPRACFSVTREFGGQRLCSACSVIGASIFSPLSSAGCGEGNLEEAASQLTGRTEVWTGIAASSVRGLTKSLGLDCPTSPLTASQSIATGWRSTSMKGGSG